MNLLSFRQFHILPAIVTMALLAGVSPSRGQVYEKVVSFTDALRNSVPRARSWSQQIESILVGSDGNVYGTTVLNTNPPVGTIFKMTPEGLITTMVDLTNADQTIQLRTLGAYDQKIYGITPAGGAQGCGKMFKASHDSFISLVEFTGIAGIRPGRNPDALFQATDGFFYGTTLAGGGNDFGTVYRITGIGNGFETLAEFSGSVGTKKGKTPLGLFEAADGNVYGFTSAGGLGDFGSIFRIKKTGEFSSLVEFTGLSGARRGISPISMIQSLNGNLYGISTSGGANNHGVVFKLSLQGEFSIIHDFSDETPEFELIQHPTGDIYGLTNKSIFRVTRTDGFEMVAGLGYEVSKFDGSSQTTYYSASSKLVIANDGNLYLSADPGITFSSLDGGHILQIRPSGVITRCGSFKYYSFSDFVSLSPSHPKNLVALSNGDILGVTTGGIDYRLGFQATYEPAGHIIRITPPNTSSMQTYFFGKTEYLDAPVNLQDAVLQGRGQDHNFYGTSVNGGESNFGTVFKLAPSGELATLHSFKGVDGINSGGHLVENGRHPTGDLIEDQNGNLRGLTLAKPADYEYYGPRGFCCSKSGHHTPWGLTTNSSAEHFVGGFTSRRGLTKAGNGADLFGVYPVEYFDSFRLAIEWKIYREGTDGVGQDLASLEASPGSTMLEVNDPGGPSYLGTTLTGGVHGDGTVYKFSPNSVHINPVPRAASFDNSGGNFSSSINWQNIPIGQRNGRFSVSFSLTPGAPGMDGIVGLSQGAADWYSDMPCTLRINPAGQFDAIKGSNFYQAENLLNYVVGRTYQVEMTVDFASKTYSATVDGTVIADNYAFRADQAGATDLDTLVIKHESGSHTVTGVSFLKQGRHPLGALIRGSDGNFYGTTSYGGASNFGTVYRMSPAGALTKLVDFSGNGETNKGSNPIAGLVEYQGVFYGTTSAGGTGNLGTVFKMTPAGALETIFQFSVDSQDSIPMGRLIVGFDGNLYGTTSGSDGGAGSVYRLVFDGVPAIYPLAPPPKSLGSATVKVKINPRGGVTNASVEYGTDGVNFISLPLVVNLTGKRSLEQRCALSNLRRGETYYYRFRANNAEGETISPTQCFSTYPVPAISILPATLISTTSAKFNGNVDPLGEHTTVSFEWGTDGNNFPNTLLALPATVTGNTSVAASVPVAGLLKGTTYYFRISATNAGGTTISGTQSFTTLTEPLAITGDANALSTTRASVAGSVNPQGSNAAVSFEYGTDGINFPNSFSAVPASVNGSESVAVTATLTGLQQGTTYSYRVRASGPGGTGLGAIRTFSLSILSGLVQVFPDLPPPSSGTVKVNFDPPNLGAWRFAGETAWRNSGVAATQLASGPRLIEFLPLAGRISPPSETLDVVSSHNIVLDRIYFETTTTGSGSLTVRLKPNELAAPQVPAVTRAQWRFVGESQWRESGGISVSGLAAGSYLVESKPVAGKVTPPKAAVSIVDGNSRELTLTYFTANTTGAAVPLPLPFTSVSADEDLPFAYVGQIRTTVGSSTGFVVKRRVVATAGHVVFDDGTLSYITGMQWLFQRHAGQYEPKPQVPRGTCLATGYATQRVADIQVNGGSPGEGSPQSQTLDYAALYFLEEAGRGGYGGFLATDAEDDNEFLTSSAPKILAGFAVDGVPVADEGKLHATPVFNAALSPSLEETWTSTAIRGYGGMSGGPLFVQRPNGLYLPAAIYLGGNGQTVVRAINSSVVDLFLRAEVAGNGGDNNTGGGITHTRVTTFGTVSDFGSIRITILPAAAASVARWGLQGEPSSRESGSISSGRSAGNYILQLTTINGFLEPIPQAVRINGGQSSEIQFTYARMNPFDTWRQTNFQTISNTGDAADSFDFDKDGLSNLSEYAAATDPKNAADVFKILTTNKGTTSYTVTAAGKASRSYILERRANLDRGPWDTVTSIGPLASDGPVNLTDPSIPNNSAFYRIRVSAP